MTKRLFRQEHPVLMGFIILGVLFVGMWGGITFIISSLTRPSQPEKIFGKREGVGVIEVKGVITTSEATIADLTAFRENNAVKAIVLRIDSPGGAVGASQELYEEVRRTNQKKPVIASMGSVAASGGYYAALGAEKIIASRGTLTGSIGVILKFANLKELFDKIGYKSEVVKSGKLKDIGSPDRPLTDAERELLQALIDNVYGQFVQAVADSRKLPEEKVRALADGRIFSGEQAKDAGLIDEFGNFTDAVTLAAELGGLDKEEPPYLIYPQKDEFSLLTLLTGDTSQTLLKRAFLQSPVLAYEMAVGR